MANPFFNVFKEEVLTVSGRKLNKFAIINEDNGEALGIVSKNYEIVENRAVADLFDEAVKSFNVLTVSDNLDSIGKRWKRRYIFAAETFSAEILPGDVTGVMLEAFNSYDAKSSFGFEVMGYRYLCSNGMVLGKRSLFQKSYSHFFNAASKLTSTFVGTFGNVQNYFDMWKEWAQIPYTKDNFAGYVSSKKYIGPKVGEVIIEAWDRGLREQNLEATKWGAYNVLTWLATHHTKARKGSNLFSGKYNNINRLASEFHAGSVGNKSIELAMIESADDEIEDFDDVA